MSATDTSEPEAGAKKRKLSAGTEASTSGGDHKRAKGKPSIPPETDQLPETLVCHNAQAAPPASEAVEETFYTYQDALVCILYFGDGENDTFYHKLAIHEAWNKHEANKAKEIESTTETDAELPFDDCAENVAQWKILIPNEDQLREGGRAHDLVKLFKADKSG